MSRASTPTRSSVTPTGVCRTETSCGAWWTTGGRSADWLNAQGFTSVQGLGYWTSTTYAYNDLTSNAWFVDLGTITVDYDAKASGSGVGGALERVKKDAAERAGDGNADRAARSTRSHAARIGHGCWPGSTN